ncbi:DUF5765 domain-containing protein [Aestuariibius sp. 2305UL40-4]|uniref:DUF5765 domain-containing protein n=1 Tax=Aestuariibius violaceus TaxID=3234132 RepID=UPI00345E15C0
MCWSPEATLAMVGIGAVATEVTRRRGEPVAIWGTLGYFTGMEVLQAAGYLVIDQCGTPGNRTVTALSYLHIAFQPLVINAFALHLVPEGIRRRWWRTVMALSGLASLILLAKLLPWPVLGPCVPGTALCAEAFCTRAGEWHLAWDVHYNGLTVPFEAALGIGPGFPEYMLAVFLMPIVYGAWRFVVLHALVGPILALQLTSDPGEMPAIWCLFSIGLLLIGLSPAVRRQVSTTRWWGREVRA